VMRMSDDLDHRYIWRDVLGKWHQNTPCGEGCELFEVAPGIQIAAIAFGWTAQASGAL